MSSDTEVYDHAASIEVTCGWHIVSSSRYRWPSQPDMLPIVASQIPHDAGLSLVPEKISKQHAFCSTEPRHDVLDHAATVRDERENT